ncbi:MAG TPA: universal stress protein [Candidatus Binatia bacterium]
MKTELYVGGLPHSVSDGELKGLFSNYGTVVSGGVIKGRFTRQSRGYGFVVMASQEEADKAIEKLNGSGLEGRTIVVRDAHPQMIRKILCPVDFSSQCKAGVAYAISLAQQNHAELVFLHVTSIPATDVFDIVRIYQSEAKAFQAPDFTVSEFLTRKESRLKHFIMDNFEDQIRQLRWRVEIGLGKVSNEIANVAARQDFDLIVFAKKPKGWLTRHFSRSVSESTTRLAHCPVVCIGEAAKTAPWRGRPLRPLEGAHQYS